MSGGISVKRFHLLIIIIVSIFTVLYIHKIKTPIVHLPLVPIEVKYQNKIYKFRDAHISNWRVNKEIWVTDNLGWKVYSIKWTSSDDSIAILVNPQKPKIYFQFGSRKYDSIRNTASEIAYNQTIPYTFTNQINYTSGMCTVYPSVNIAEFK